jgi:hypothetical protein
MHCVTIRMESSCKDEVERCTSHSYLHCWTLYHNRRMKNEQMQNYLKFTWYAKKCKEVL